MTSPEEELSRILCGLEGYAARSEALRMPDYRSVSDDHRRSRQRYRPRGARSLAAGWTDCPRGSRLDGRRSGAVAGALSRIGSRDGPGIARSSRGSP